MRRVGARFCQNSVSLWAPDPQGGASSHTGSPSMCLTSGCLSVPGTFSMTRVILDGIRTGGGCDPVVRRL